jgi:hypothetical protein
VTETPDVAHALDLAAIRWPGEPRARLLLHLVEVGGAALVDGAEAEKARRRQAIRASSGKYAGAFGPDYLAELRADWPD